MPNRQALQGVAGRVPQPEISTADVEDLRALVTISREHPTDCGQREVIVRLDQGPRVVLKYGQTVTSEVQPGVHHLRAHNTLVWKNVHFTIEPGEHLDFVVINEARWWTYGMVAVLGSAPLFLKVLRRSRQ
jgi:hypothetical protein